MKSLTPRQVKAQQTKKKILDTALHLFSEKGFNKVTVDEIVAATNTSKGAFYNHFKSKHEIFIEKFKEIDDFYLAFEAELSPGITAEEKLLQLVHAQMNYLRDYLGKDLVRTIYMNAIQPNNDRYIAQESRPLYRIVESFFAEGIENEEFSTKHSSVFMTRLFTRCLRGTLYDWCLYEEKYELVNEATLLIETLLEGFKRK
ncbi:TetR/AcrR family transcriptional regulator [Bacillus tianshenii]|nr:TetR/AcrR family transcriptional regulator [Bacillus tianshenii]